MSIRVDSRSTLDDDVALDLRGLVRAIVRRWPAVLLVTVACAAAAFATARIVPPTFRAETKIIIENREMSLSGAAQTAPDRGLIDAETVSSQVQMLTSRDLARRVANRHGLADRQEFDGASGSLLESLLVAAGLGRDRLRISPEERVLDAFMDRLKVYRVEGSRVVVVEFSSRDPDLAAAVANSVAEEYMALQGEAKRRTSEDQTRWLGDEIQRLRTKVREAEATVEAYRTGSDLIVGENNTTIARQQITDLTNAIAAARSEKASAEARANELAALLESPDGIVAAADVIDSESFRALRSRDVALRGRESELAVTLLPGHPQMQAVRSQIEELRRQQVAEARRALESLRNDARVAETRIRVLGESLDEMKVTSAENGESEVELRALEREAASQRNLLEGLLVRYREAVARQNAADLPADARVISRASTPAEPTFPKTGMMTLLAGMAGFLLSVGWIVSAEFVSGRALVRISATPDKPRALFDLVAEQSMSGPAAPEAPADPPVRSSDAAPSVPAFETAEGLHALLAGGDDARIVMMTVGQPEALAPAIEALSGAATEAGTRLIVVDAVSRNAGRTGAGLSDLVAGRAAFGDVIHRNRRTRAHEIGVGEQPVDAGVFGGETLETILSALENAYDMVVVSLGDVNDEDFGKRMPVVADRIVLVGRPSDAAVAEASRALVESGVGAVSILMPPDGEQPARAA